MVGESRMSDRRKPTRRRVLQSAGAVAALANPLR
jgi:hypothetical protein